MLGDWHQIIDIGTMERTVFIISKPQHELVARLRILLQPKPLLFDSP